MFDGLKSVFWKKSEIPEMTFDSYSSFPSSSMNVYNTSLVPTPGTEKV